MSLYIVRARYESRSSRSLSQATFDNDNGAGFYDEAVASSFVQGTSPFLSSVWRFVRRFGGLHHSHVFYVLVRLFICA